MKHIRTYTHALLLGAILAGLLAAFFVFTAGDVSAQTRESDFRSVLPTFLDASSMPQRPVEQLLPLPSRPLRSLNATSTEQNTLREHVIEDRIARARDIREAHARAASRVRELRERRADIAEKIQSHISEQARTVAERMLHRLESALERLSGLLERVDSRLEKIAARGIDTSEADALVIDAYSAIEAARYDISQAQAALDVIAESDTPREHLREMKVRVREAVASLKTAHTAVVNAIRAMSIIAPPPSSSPDDTAE